MSETRFHVIAIVHDPCEHVRHCLKALHESKVKKLQTLNVHYWCTRIGV